MAPTKADGFTQEEIDEIAASEERAKEREELLEAELAVAKLERKLLKAKHTKAGPPRALKQQVRDARQAFRARRDGLTVVKDERGRLEAVPEGVAEATKEVAV